MSRHSLGGSEETHKSSHNCYRLSQLDQSLVPVTSALAWNVPQAGFTNLIPSICLFGDTAYFSFVNPLLFASCTDTVKLLEA
jgi:hypothetical protein